MKKRPEEGDIYRGKNFDTYGSKNLNCEINFHTFCQAVQEIRDQMIRVKLMLLTQQTLLHINPSHQDEPFQSIKPQVWPKIYRRGKKLGRKRAKAR